MALLRTRQTSSGVLRAYRNGVSAMIDRTFARAFCGAIDRRMEQRRYRTSPGALHRGFRDALAADRYRGFSPTGVLRGKAAIRPYWGAGIVTAEPPLKSNSLMYT